MPRFADVATLSYPILTPRRRLSLATLSGLLLFLSFPKFGHGAVAWIALAPLLLALPGATQGQAFRLGYVTGFLSSVGLLYWTAWVVAQYGGSSLGVGVALMLLLAAVIALFPALATWLTARGFAAAGPAGLLLLPVAWVATEMVRLKTFWHFPWCLLGYSQWRFLPVIQVASLTSVLGVSFLVALGSAVAAYALLERRPRLRGVVTGGFAALLGAVLGYGAWSMAGTLPTAGRLRVALVQGNVPLEERWAGADSLAPHVALTRQAAERGAQLVVWPESAVLSYYDSDAELAAGLRALARERGVYLLFGNDDRADLPGGGYRVWVGAKMLSPQGELVLRYHKVRLVPFGEYVPMQPLVSLGGRYAAKLVREVADFTPGDGPVVGRAHGHGLAAFICYEAIFPDLAREATAQGADLLVNVTNDAWYGRSSAPYQHLAQAVFRAVENRKYLVRAANTGISAVVDPWGRILERTELFERALIVRDVPIVPGLTLYARGGDALGWACVAGAGLLLAATSRRLRVWRSE